MIIQEMLYQKLVYVKKSHQQKFYINHFDQIHPQLAVDKQKIIEDLINNQLIHFRLIFSIILRIY